MRNVIIVLIVFLGGLLSGALLLTDLLIFMSDSKDMEAVDSIEHARKHLIPGYVCPMHPGVVSNALGSCPICGMDLEQKNLDSMDSDAGGVAVSPTMSNSLGVRIALAETGRVSEPVFASGFVESVTPAQTTEVSARVEGSLTRVLVATGDWVAEGETLLEIDSTAFAETQAAYLEARAVRDHEKTAELRKQLVTMQAREVVLAGMDRETGQPLPPEYLLTAPHSGFVEWVAPVNSVIELEQPLVRIEAPNVARANLRSYARAARSVKPGRRAQLDLPHLPGLYWPGRVVEVIIDAAGFYSVIEADFEVPQGAVNAGAFVGAYVNAGTSEEVLRIPATAVIVGEGQSRVVRLRSDGRFEPVAVESGFIGNEWAAIHSGLSEGDAVVERAQFLIDSEATLRAGFSRITE